MKKPTQYWDRAWSLVEGCTPCSPGCEHCWSAAMAHRFGQGLTDEGGFYKGQVKFRDDRLGLPLSAWKPAVWAIWTDLFHEDVDSGAIVAAFHTMAYSPVQTFLVLTKRAERMREMLTDLLPLKSSNAWLGVTVCNQAEADEKIPLLLQTPAAHRYVSVEPMLGPVDLRFSTSDHPPSDAEPFQERHWLLDWIIAGPETGPGKRPCDPAWIRDLYEQCKSAGVPFFDKSPEPLARELPF